MKLLHLSDLHIGKRVNEFSMLEDQEYILTKIINIIDDEKPDAILIAGDVYDKSVPSAEAVQLFDDFLVKLARRRLAVLIISGNHDSPERIAFGGRIISQSGVFLSPVYDGHLEPIILKDAYGEVDFFLLPFIKPAHVRRFFLEEPIETYTDALRAALREANPDPTHRTVLLTHQFITGAARSDSEEISIGGSDNVDAEVFHDFDYVALGHLHGPQQVQRPTIRYCGTPLKYSFGEAGHTKSVTLVELGPKGTVEIRTLPLTPKRDMRELKGGYLELTARETYQGTPKEDYLHITLTDEEDIPDVIGKLRSIYPNIMKVDYDNQRTRTSAQITVTENLEQKTPLALFEELFELQNNKPLTQQQRGFAQDLIETIWEGQK